MWFITLHSQLKSMKINSQINSLHYPDFIHELNVLLHSNGIFPSRSPILAEFQSKTNRVSQESSKIDQQVGKVILYMDEHLSDELSLENLAEEIGLSKYQLIRRFREEEGTTPWKFLVSRRIERVKELLKEGTPPGQAAMEAGFYDQSHLNKVFREEMGLTPKQYQEKNFKNRN